MKVVLASQSRYRMEQLDRFGLQYTAVKPLADEDELKSRYKAISPKRLAAALAREKALSVQKAHPSDIIIGCDQLVNLNGRILGKPETRERAIAMLKSMSGKTHQLITSIYIVHENRHFADTVIASIALRKLNREEIVRYVHRDRPMDSAGSYKFELSGWNLVRRISTPDPSALIGLPLIALTEGFRKLKIPMPFLSRRN